MIDHDFWGIHFVNECEDDSYCEFFEGTFYDAVKYATENCPPGYIIYGVFVGFGFVGFVAVLLIAVYPAIHCRG